MGGTRRKRDLTLMKQGAMFTIFIVAAIFNSDIRSVFGGGVDVSDRVLRLEVQNEDHGRMQQQLNGQMNIIDGIQKAQVQMIAQVEALSQIVNAMQDREYERLISARDVQ